MNRPLVAPVVRRGGALALLVVLLTLIAPTARAEERMYFPAYENVTSVLVAKINAETVRVDISAWYLTEHAISIALLNRFHAGVPVRLIGDRVAIFESDPLTKREFYWLAAQGVPIRLRYYPEWFPEIVHWKAAIFVGQGEVAFGSANFTPFELAPVSAADYKDETVLVTDDSSIVNAFKTMFDRFWTDVTTEPRSRIVNPPFFKDWNEACALESACADFATLHPNPTPMVIDRRRLEPDYPLPAEMVWSQGPAFNNRLIQEIDREATQVDLVAYRLTVSTVADALIRKFQSGVPVRFMVDPEQYTSRVWPEYWLTRANVDRMWVAGIPIRQRVHTGLTHMKTLITSAVATNASSNIAEFWQRDHNYFIPSATKPQLHQALRDRFEEMWSDPNAFGPFTPLAADAARLVSPLNGSGGLPGGPTLTWARAPFATSYDIYLGSSGGTMTRVANVPAVLSSTPPDSYSWTPVTPLAPGTTYQWRVVSRTFATDVNPALVAASSTWSFTTQASTGGNPLPSGWSTRDVGATGLAGSAGYANGVFTVSGAGADIWGNSDAFRFVYQTLTGDGEIVARVVTQQNTHQYAKAGIMIRQSLAANAAHVILDTVPAPGTEFMTRGATGAATAYLGGTTAGAPRWLRLTRSGTSVAAAVSANGSSWTTVGSATLPAGTAYVGLIVSSLNTAQLNTSTFDNVSVNGGTAPPPPLGLPAPWTTSDIGTTTIGGSASYADGVFTVTGSGQDIWGNTDGFRFVYQPLAGDGQIVARVVTQQNTHRSAKAGVMIRQSLAANSAHVILDTVPAPGTEFMQRSATGAATSYLNGTVSGAPQWLRLTRSGTTVTAAVSPNGTTWTSLGAATLPGGSAYVGLVVSSVNTSQTNTSTFDNVSVLTDGVSPPVPPAPDIVVYASDVAAAARHGVWAPASDPASPAGTALATPDQGYAQTNAPLAGPAHYVDVTFTAPADVPYRLWLRLRATADSKYNDAVWIQFSDARANGSPVYPLNTSSGLLVNLATDASGASLQGWGWANGAYWFNQPTTFSFASSGTHTLRIQVREDGVAVDQIVLSPGTYLSTAPGGPSNDTTIVPKP